MSQANEIEEEYLTCYICYDVFTEPKTLACLHRFCEKCLQGYLLGQGDIARKKSFLCPVCREPCPCPNPRRPPSDWAGLLKTDFHLKNLIDALRADKEKRGRKVDVVHPCSSHADKEQDLYCLDCKVSICHLCAGISHRGCSQVMTLTDAAHDRRATFDLQQRQLTKRLLQVNQLREKIASAMEKITRQRSEAECAIREASLATLTLVQRRETEQVEELAKRFESLRGAVAKRVVAMDRQISACEQVLETAAAKMASSSDVDLVKSLAGVLGEDALDLDMDTAEAFLTRLRNIRLDFVATPVANIKLGDVVVKVEGNEHPPKFDTTTATTTTTTITTTTHRNSTTAVEASSATVPSSNPQRNFSVAIRDFSTVSMNAKTTHKNTLNCSSQNASTSTGGFMHKGVNPGSNTLSSRYRPPIPPKRHRAETFATMETKVDGEPALLRTISSRFREDELAPKLRDVLVVGSAADRLALVTDWANQCVKAFYKRRERDSRLDVGGKPWCLAKVTDVQVAVSLPMSQQICLLKVLPRLSLQSSFLAQKRYSGLAALSPDVLVASGGSDPPCVDVINLGGEVLRSFSQDPCTSQDLFSYPAYIAMTPSKKRFLVSDRRKSALISLDTSGHVAFHFRPDGSKSLRKPSGVCADAFGRVYLAESRGVVRLSPQGVFDRPLLKAQNGVEDPGGLDIDEEGLLYVTSRQEDILVFRVY